MLNQNNLWWMPTRVRSSSSACWVLRAWLCAGLFLIAIIPCAAQQVQFQIMREQAVAENSAEESMGIFPYDRQRANQFDRFQRLIKDPANYADALEGLDALLAQDQDSAVKPVRGKETYQSIKREALRLIQNLPPEGREAYELQFGPAANKALIAALQSGQPTALANVVRRYYHTKAGYQAALLLGRYELDHGQVIAAAQLFQGLLDTPSAKQQLGSGLTGLAVMAWHRAGQTSRSADIIAKHTQEPNAEKLTLQGQTPPNGANATQLVTWIENNFGPVPRNTLVMNKQWAMFRGHPTRNASMSGGAPLLTPRWNANVVNQTQLGYRLYQDRKGLLNNGLPAIPGLQALAVDKYVIFRTPIPQQPVMAIDFESGKLSWFVGQNTLSNTLASASDATGSNPTISERAWSNANYGGLSSDGTRVFFVEDDTHQVSSNTNQQQMMIRRRMWGGPFGGEPSVNTQSTNRLYACDIATQGKLQWVIGGSDSEMEPKLAGVTFLGPPLPLNGVLYSIIELKQAITLVAIDAATGKLQWQQELLMLDEQTQAMFAHWRRISGVTPSYAEGYLICPTSTGDLVAVDLTHRTLAWIHQGFSRVNQQEIYNTPLMAMLNNGQSMMAPGSTWSEDTAVISQGHVLYTSPEVNKLFCLDLTTGKLKWELPRQNFLYLGGVVGDKVLVVGKQNVQCFRLSNKEVLWKSALALPSGSTTSGRGFMSGESYYLPVSSGEVLKVDLLSGTLSPRGKSPSRSIPGNLLCYQGHVLSMSVDRLEKYPQSDLLKSQIEVALKKNQNDWQALAWRGEIALDDAQTDGAINDFEAARKLLQDELKLADSDSKRSAYLLGEADRLRGLLFQVRSGRIRQDFQKYASDLPLLEPLIVNDAERSQWLRLSAQASHALGERAVALGKYLELANLGAENDALDEVELNYEVRHTAWIQARLRELWSTATTDEKASWEQQLDKHLTQITALPVEKQRASLKRYVSLFDFYPGTDAAREKLVQLLGSEAPQLSEKLLQQLVKSADLDQQRRATARMASLYQATGREDQAAKYYRILKDRHAQEICLENMTGQQWYDSVPADSTLGKLLAGQQAWPIGVVEEVKQTAREGNFNGNYPMLVRIELQQTANSPLQGYQLLFDQNNNNTLLVRNAAGQDIMRLQLMMPNQPDNSIHYIQPQGLYAVVQDHLLIVNIGWRIYAYNLLQDTVAKNRTTTMQPTWSYEFVDAAALQMQAQNQGVITFQDQKIFGITKRRATNPVNNQAYGNVAFAGRLGVVVHRQREVSLLDPLTGEVRWTRRGLAEDAELLTDDQHVVVVPRSLKASTEMAEPNAFVINAADGSLLNKIKLPGRETMLQIVGTSFFTTQTVNDKIELHHYNAVTGDKETVAKYPVSQRMGAKGALLDGRLAVLSFMDKPNLVQFEVFDTAQGKRLFATPFQHQAGVNEIVVQQSAEQYLLLMNTNENRSRGKSIKNYQSASPDGRHGQLWTGNVMAFDAQTGVALWDTSASFTQHGIWLAQPESLPFYLFVRMTTSNRNRSDSGQLSVLCLCKRTGRLLYQRDDLPGQSQGFDIKIDYATKQIKLQFPHHDGNNWQRVVLAFTDKPRAPEPPFQEGLADLNSTATQNKATGVFKSLFRAVERSTTPDPEPVMEDEIIRKELQDIEAPELPVIPGQAFPVPPPIPVLPR
jgi:outer membrane protein assembly factor BamB